MDYYYTTAKAAIALLLICTFFVVRLDGNNDGKDHLLEGREVEVEDHDDYPQQQSAEPPPPIIDTAQTLFSLPNSRLALLHTAASNCWIKLRKLLLKHGHHHLSPAPSLDFRDRVDATTDGAGEKVKEAFVKSLDKSKVAVEDSARSAAKLAWDAMENAAQKVTRTLSDAGPQSENEL